ncbi:MAG: PhoH-like protein [Spirochaetes bacterium ADurb.Bin218]|jgi:phosphate starvation-inducible PhoH-like protein|nr:PhoH family protein [Spirochaetota bacterium]OQA97484.1 MAG: PhoH-like protein [Spirochaetes bacterium ADurb.Bin218]HOV07789.1 PhoH family protein [Spirochaetota bacterium]HPX92234.1 PhoH family protein [Spirochaetota bacterium]
MYQESFEIDDTTLYKRLCGHKDKNLRHIEHILGVTLIPRGNTIIIQSETEAEADKAMELLHLLSDYISNKEPGKEIDDFEVKYITSSLKSGQKLKVDDINSLKIYIPDTNRTIVPRTVNQANYLRAINRSPITFGIGPAGTGKTYLAVVAAINYFLKGKVERIILTRPAVEAGENLGFLPGDLVQKINPYLRPLYDALFELLSMDRVASYIEKGYIEIAPLAYMRGRTLNNAYIILDEAQNTTVSQMKMFLTRLGVNSKFVISGDVTQIDLAKPLNSGLIHCQKILKNIDGIEFIQFSKEDISRHPVVEKIVAAYEESGYNE